MTEALSRLERSLGDMGLAKHYIHAGPIIRQEDEYRVMEPKMRIKILKNLMAFFRNIDIRCTSFYIEKKHFDDEVEAAGRLSREISGFIKMYYEYFMSFDKVKIYYDNGQVEVNKILSAVFNVLLKNVEFKKVILSDYRLFQIADLVCTLKLVQLKLDRHSLSKSEKNFFGDKRTIRKNYLKPMTLKEF